MSFIEIVIMCLKASFSEFSALLYAALVAIACFGILHFLGTSVYKGWSGGLITKLICTCVMLAGSLLIYGLSQSEAYLTNQAAVTKNTIAGDVVWRNQALTYTWDALGENSDQGSLDHPDLGGTDIVLSSIAHAQIYSQNLAGSVRSILEADPSNPTLLEYRADDDVALQFVSESSQLKTLSYPTTVNQDNFIADGILDIRTTELLEQKLKLLDAEKGQFRSSLLIGMVAVFLIGIGLVINSARLDLIRPC